MSQFPTYDELNEAIYRIQRNPPKNFVYDKYDTIFIAPRRFINLCAEYAKKFPNRNKSQPVEIDDRKIYPANHVVGDGMIFASTFNIMPVTDD